MDNLDKISDQVDHLINYTKTTYLKNDQIYTRGRGLETMFEINDNSQTVKDCLRTNNVKSRIINITDKNYLINNVEACNEQINIEKALLPHNIPRKIRIIGFTNLKQSIRSILLLIFLPVVFLFILNYQFIKNRSRLKYIRMLRNNDPDVFIKKARVSYLEKMLSGLKAVDEYFKDI